MKVVQLDPDSWEEGRGYRKNRLLPAQALRQPGTLLQIVAIPAGAHVPPHSHRTSVEVYVVRRGVCELTVNGARHEMRPGDVMLMVGGGHGFRMLEDTIFLEIKQGPYSGLDEKEQF